ncbi:MAG: nucleotide exchange factor GrpE [Planctomycetes bacterium]|nr:nucleotide exchange factor GrpE [Planctomycetota bacterium]
MDTSSETPVESAEADAQAEPSASADTYLREAEALTAEMESAVRRMIGDLPSQAQLAEVHAMQSSIRELVERAARGGTQSRGESDKLRSETERLHEAVKRSTADFLNYQERARRELRAAEEQALRGYVSDLLPILDSVDLALADARREGAGVEAVRAALEMIAQSFGQVLTVRGLERIEPLGQPFDPNFHESVVSRPADPSKGEEPNRVAEVCRAGYLWKGKVLRPAQVLITTGPKKS